MDDHGRGGFGFPATAGVGFVVTYEKGIAVRRLETSLPGGLVSPEAKLSC
jgi:hypothetical protein